MAPEFVSLSIMPSLNSDSYKYLPYISTRMFKCSFNYSGLTKSLIFIPRHDFSLTVHSLNGSSIHLDAHTSKLRVILTPLFLLQTGYITHILLQTNCPKCRDFNSMSYYRTVSVSQESGHDSVVDLWLQVSPNVTGKLLLKATVSSRLYWVRWVCFQTHLCSNFFQTSVSYRLLD